MGENFSNDIGGALSAMRSGRKVARVGWNGKNMYLELQVPDANSKMTLPYVYQWRAAHPDRWKVPDVDPGEIRTE